MRRPIKEEESQEETTTTTTAALAITISREEYATFCRQCARERLPVPDRQTAIAAKTRFPGSWNGSPAWLQLRAFPGQKSARLWLCMERDQVLMEVERQDLTPPALSPKEAVHAAARERFLLEG